MPEPGPPAQLSLFDEVAAAPTPPAPAPPPPPLPASPRARHDVLLGEHRVAYELKRARRRSIGFSVGPEGLAVSAPRWVGLAEIDGVLRGKAAWILRKLHEQQDRARRQLAARVEWCEGSAVPFLGDNVILVLDPRCTGAVLHGPHGAARRPPEGVPHASGRPVAVLHGAEGTLPGVPALTLHLGLPQQASAEQVREVVQSWLQRQALRIFEERCGIYAQRLGVRVRRLALSSAATRWGSASADGSIRLNWRLVHFGLPVIDYVVAHELAHLREMNHSPAFWDVVRSVVPGYEQARAVLRDRILPPLE